MHYFTKSFTISPNLRVFLGGNTIGSDAIAVLLIEDNSDDVGLLWKPLLEDIASQFQFTSTKSLSQALSILTLVRFDIILLELALSTSHELDVLVRIQEQSPEIPIIILTITADNPLALIAVQAGAQDCLVKKLTSSDLLRQALYYAIERHRLLAHIEQVRQREIGSLVRLSSPPRAAVTAQTYGQVRLVESVPEIFAALVEQYETLLDMALEQQTYRVDHQIPESLYAIAETLGFLRAGPRDVVELHRTALKTKIRNVTPQKGQAYLEEGRLLVLELMGHLVSFYRNFTLGAKESRPPKAVVVPKLPKKQ